MQGQRDHFWFLGVGVWVFFPFLIKILFVSIVPFSGMQFDFPLALFCSLSLNLDKPVCVAKCSQSYLGLSQDLQEMEAV